MKTLGIDIETFSSVDLKESGVYKYVESPDFEILLFGYAYDDGPTHVIDLTAFEDVPEQVLEDLQNPEVVKTAFNANFERTCISKHFNITCDPKQWRCTMVWSMSLGLPSSLERVGRVLKLPEQKDSKGKTLIKYFSAPVKPTKVNGGRTRNYPHHDPEKWEEYKEYNRQDVITEQALRKKLERFPLPDHEWELWALDQKINDNGVRLDPLIYQNAIELDTQHKERLLIEAKELTKLNNPNSLPQLKAWLWAKGVDAEGGITKETLPELIKAAPDDETKRVLDIRKELSKASVDKYHAMNRSVCSDQRAKGILQFAGASRTWRWAGRLIQVHNLPQNKIEDLELTRTVLREGDFELFELLYGSPSSILSQLVRTAFIPTEGHRFIVADFSAIEARVIAWLADEKWVLDVFRDHGKIYEATAAEMFKVPFETIVKGHPNYELRSKGKVATLACGYSGGPPALIAMGALKSGIPEEELPGIVKHWRNANPHIVKLWYDVEEAAITAVREKRTVKVGHGVQYRYEAGMLFADLPSGRSLTYPEIKIKPDPNFNKDGLTFKTQIKTQWAEERTYGGKLVENLVQAIARDCLAISMKRLDEAGYKIAFHVHDEVVLDVPYGVGSVDEVTEIMGQPINWAPGLPLKAAGFETEFYMKD